MIIYDQLIHDLSAIKREIDFNISKYVNSRFQGALKNEVSYITSGGKRLRGILLTLVSNEYEGNRMKTQNLAVAAELGHAASLVHDDIVDKSSYRRNSNAFWVEYGLEKAIIIPHLLISESLEIARREGPEYLKIGLETWQKAAMGQYLDYVAGTSKDSQEIDYLNMIELKSGSLFEGAAEIGATLANRTQTFAEEAKDMGRRLGIAYQLSDDYVGSFKTTEGGGSGELFKKHISNKVNNNDKIFEKLIELIKEYISPVKEYREFVLTEKLKYLVVYSIVEIFRESQAQWSTARKELESLLL